MDKRYIWSIPSWLERALRKTFVPISLIMKDCRPHTGDTELWRVMPNSISNRECQLAEWQLTQPSSLDHISSKKKKKQKEKKKKHSIIVLDILHLFYFVRWRQNRAHLPKQDLLPIKFHLVQMTVPALPDALSVEICRGTQGSSTDAFTPCSPLMHAASLLRGFCKKLQVVCINCEWPHQLHLFCFGGCYLVHTSLSSSPKERTRIRVGWEKKRDRVQHKGHEGKQTQSPPRVRTLKMKVLQLNKVSRPRQLK